MGASALWRCRLVLVLLALWHRQVNAKVQQSLGGAAWQLRNSNGTVAVQATVPGSVQLNLMRQGVIGDPYAGFNDVLTQWVALDNWTFSSSFSVGEALAQKAAVILRCDGLDTVANVTLNGDALGLTDNQFRRYSWDVTKRLRAAGEQNTISIHLSSPVQYAQRQASAYPYPVNHAKFLNGFDNANFIRKRPSDFGWDWGPAVGPVGIWRNISLLGYDHVVISDLWVEVNLERATPQPPEREESWPPVRPLADKDVFRVDVRVALDCSAHAGNLPLSATILGLASRSGKATARVGCDPADDAGTVSLVTLRVPRKDVELWWPRGYGAQPMYQLQVTVGEEIAQRRIGFRELLTVRDPLPDGEAGASMYFRVNGVPVWAKGASVVPSDALDDRLSDISLRRMLQSSAEANMNCLRLWGGADYGRDSLWDAADELGFIVWIDFQFASAVYPSHRSFVATVKAEVVHQARRLTGHASLAMWCGSNEAVKGVANEQDLGTQFVYAADLTVLFDQGVRMSLWETSPTATFYASSPSNDALVDDPARGLYQHRWLGNPFSPLYGDVRHYDYQSLCTLTSTYPRGRFVSEYGWQSYPSLHTMGPVTSPGDWSNNSTMMNHRQHHPDGNAELLAQIKRFFHIPTSANRTADFVNFIYLSQVVQSLCISTQTRFYRALKQSPGAYTYGALYWQLNDVWQAQSWSSIEYGAEPRWKLLHYAAKQAFLPVSISAFADTTGHVNVTYSSDLVSESSGLLIIETWLWNGTRTYANTSALTLTPLTSKVVWQTTVAAIAGGRTAVAGITRVQLTSDASQPMFPAATGVLLPPSFVDIRLPDPAIAATNFSSCSLPPMDNGASTTTVPSPAVCFTLAADGVAVWVQVDTPLPGRFSDNGFILVPGEAKPMQFHPWTDVVQPHQLQASLAVRSIFDTQQ